MEELKLTFAILLMAAVMWYLRRIGGNQWTRVSRKSWRQ